MLYVSPTLNVFVNYNVEERFVILVHFQYNAPIIPISLSATISQINRKYKSTKHSLSFHHIVGSQIFGNPQCDGQIKIALLLSYTTLYLYIWYIWQKDSILLHCSHCGR